MKPTAPPVKRGRPGTNGDWNSAISRRSAGTNGSSLSVVTPDRSMIVRPSRGAQHQERILAEERVARDLLAAFDALEQERVVGVLGDLEERRHRRQQVRDDLLDHRHERAAPRQLHELFEGRLLHAVSSACRRDVAVAGCRARLRRTGPRAAAVRSRARTAAPPARQHLEAADRQAARARARVRSSACRAGA